MGNAGEQRPQIAKKPSPVSGHLIGGVSFGWLMVAITGGALMRAAEAAPLPAFAMPVTDLLVLVLYAHLVVRHLSLRPPASSLRQGLAGAVIVTLPFILILPFPNIPRDLVLVAGPLAGVGAVLLILYPHVPVRALVVGWREAFRHQPPKVNQYRLIVIALYLLAGAGLWLGGHVAGITLAAMALAVWVLLTLRITDYADTAAGPRTDTMLWPLVLSGALGVLVLPVYGIVPFEWIWLPIGLLTCGAMLFFQVPVGYALVAALIASAISSTSMIAQASPWATANWILRLAVKDSYPVALMALVLWLITRGREIRQRSL